MSAFPPLRVAANPLDRLLLRVRLMRAAGMTPVLVFDLDDTLFSTSPRHLKILREYVSREDVQTRWIEDAWALSQLEIPHLRYSIVDSAAAAGVTRPELLRDLKIFWFERFFRNDYVQHDAPVAGAAEYCAQALREGATLAYLTGRDEAMRSGTIASIAKHGFPFPGGTAAHLILKPRFDTPDLEFKRGALERCAALGEVTGLFENEPAHVNLFHDAFPGAITVLIETRHSGRPIAPHPNVHKVPDFARA